MPVLMCLATWGQKMLLQVKQKWHHLVHWYTEVTPQFSTLNWPYFKITFKSCKGSGNSLEGRVGPAWAVWLLQLTSTALVQDHGKYNTSQLPYNVSKCNFFFSSQSCVAYHSRVQYSFFFAGCIRDVFAIQRQCWHMQEMTDSISVIKELNQNQSTDVFLLVLKALT